MRFLADEGIDKPVVIALRKAGFDIDYILELNPGVDDEIVLQTANSEKRILLTQDKDFGELVYRLKYVHSGIVLIRLEGYAPELKGKIITELLLQHQEELPNAFTVIQPNAIRIRK